MNKKMGEKLKEQKKKLILWEGFKKELPWILFWIAILIIAVGYFQDKKICDEVLKDPCSVCYNLNQTEYNTLDKLIYEDTNPNSRTIKNYFEPPKNFKINLSGLLDDER